jgi:hypothetical protein
MRNFLEYLVVSPEEWIEKWSQWSNSGNFRLIRNINIDSSVIDETQLSVVLKELTKLSPIEGVTFCLFSIQSRNLVASADKLVSTTSLFC